MDSTKKIRAKPAKPKETTAMTTEYEITCPRCNTVLRGGIGPHVLRMACFHCQKPIDLIWGISPANTPEK